MAETHENTHALADPLERIACRKCGAHVDVSDRPFFSLVVCPECGTEQTVPAQFGPFLLLDLLGAGGMGAVYRALDQALGRYVAIKVMKASMGNDDQFVESFLREARAAAAINHRNVVQIYSCGQEKGQPYIVMELVSGGRMDEMVASGEPFDEARAIEIGIDVARGLSAANEIGLIHGDIKPANILLDREDVAKVADFGLAMFVNRGAQPGEIWGTPYYIAPEKARGQKVDHRSDIYSLGATLYHALGARPPFEGHTAADVVLARLKNPAVGLRVVRPSVQPETADLVARMLEADPFMRYPTYTSLLADMAEALRVVRRRGSGGGAPQVGGKKKSRKGLWIAIAVVAALAIGGGILLKPSKPPPTPPPTPPPETPTEPAPLPTTPEEPSKPETPPPEPAAESLRTIELFTSEEDKTLAEALGQYTTGGSDAVDLALDQMYRRSESKSIHRYWIRMLQVIPVWDLGRIGQGERFIQDVVTGRLSPYPQLKQHPGVMFARLAKFLQGKVTEKSLVNEAQAWPSWYVDVVHFYIGMEALRQNRIPEARAALIAYMQGDPTTLLWPHALEAYAKAWLAQLDEWDTISPRVDALVDEGNFEEARAQLDAFRKRCSSFLRPLLAAPQDRMARIEKEQESQQRGEQLEAHRARVQQDLDILDAIRTDTLQLVAAKEYLKARTDLSRSLTAMKTPEGKAAFQVLRESYTRMDELKEFLTKQLSEKPYPHGSATELGNNIIGADRTGIRVTLGRHGDMVRTWDQVSVRLFVQLASHYLSDASPLPAAERADRLLSLAVFCYFGGGFKPAETYAAQATALQPELEATVNRLMPDILP